MSDKIITHINSDGGIWSIEGIVLSYEAPITYFYGKDYKKELIKENIYKYTNKEKEVDFYYTVNEIEMNEQEYKRYLEKEKVHYNLTNKFKFKPMEKKTKI